MRIPRIFVLTHMKYSHTCICLLTKPSFSLYPMYKAFCVGSLNIYMQHEPITSIKHTKYINDPSAGSPTETLLRLLLPLNHQVWSTLAIATAIHKASQSSPPEISLNDSIGSSDGRCVQSSGTYSMQASDSHLLDIPGSYELFQSIIPTMKPVEWFPNPFGQGARLWLHCISRAAQNI